MVVLKCAKRTLENLAKLSGVNRNVPHPNSTYPTGGKFFGEVKALIVPIA